MSGQIHRCGADCTLRLPNRDATLICPISGRCFDQSIARSPFQRTTKRVLVNTTVAPSAAPRRHRAVVRVRPTPTRGAFREAVLLVLAPKKLRVAPNAKRLPDARIDYYADATAAFWGTLVSTDYGRRACTKLRVLDVVLGVLYTMRVGMRCPYTDRVAMVHDAALERALPSVASVQASGIPKKLIRVGKNHVRSAVLELCSETPLFLLPLYAEFASEADVSSVGFSGVSDAVPETIKVRAHSEGDPCGGCAQRCWPAPRPKRRRRSATPT